MDAWLTIPLMIIVHHWFTLRRDTHLADRNMYREHLGTDTLTNLGPMSLKFVRDKIKIIQRYQSSILGLKLEPLTTAHVGSANIF